MKCPYCNSDNVKKLPEIGIAFGIVSILISIWLLIIPPIGILGILIGIASILYGLFCKATGKKQKASHFCKACHKGFIWNGEKSLKQGAQ